jgi:rRNA maturation endonuclease Nob1
MKDRREIEEERLGILESKTPQYPSGSRRCRRCGDVTTLRNALECARCGDRTEVI